MEAETDQERFERHMASFGENEVWDEDTKQLVYVIRTNLNRPVRPTISQLQKMSLKSRPFRDESLYQITEEELPVPPQDDIRQLFLEAVKGIADVEFTTPELNPVQIEWISRHQDDKTASSLSSGLQASPHRDPVVLHFHGGGHFQSDPKGYRPLNAQLASLTGGPVVSVRFRLAPQHPFPAPLLDALLVYLSLIYRPSTSTLSAVEPSRIVLAGDSSGGILIYGLLQIIRYLNTHEKKCHFQNHIIQFPIPYPAGSAVLSPAGEQLQALPSQRKNSVNDLYPPEMPWASRTYPRCVLWPTTPPRMLLHCGVDALRSPLNTVALVQDWRGLPPMWFGVGQEKWYDGAKVVARRAAQSGIQVTWVEYEAMPHCFPMVPGFNKMRQTSDLMRKWASFCVDCVNGKVNGRVEQVQASLVSFKSLEERSIPLELASDPPLEAVAAILEKDRCDQDRIWKESGPDGTTAKL